MTSSNDHRRAMARFPSPEQAEALLHGATDLGDLHEADGLTRLFSTMRASGPAAAPAAEARAIAAIAESIRTPAQFAPRRRRMFTRLMSVKAALAGLAMVLAGGTAAAAATGTLPDPAQKGVATALAHVGVSVPNPRSSTHIVATDTTDTTDPTGTTDTTVAPTTTTVAGTTATTVVAPDDAKGVGPDATGPAKHGLCRAYAASHQAEKHHKHQPVAFRNLERAAAAAGQTVEEYCTPAPPSDSTTATTVPDTSPTTVAGDDGDGTTDNTDGGAPSATTGDHGHGNGHGNGNGHGGSSGSSHGNANGHGQP
jgi:hypothetical protein